MTNGTVELYRVSLLRTGSTSLDNVASYQLFDPAILVTSLAWSPEKPEKPEKHTGSILGTAAVSLSNGHIATVGLDRPGTVTGNILSHSEEAWIVAWSHGKWTKPVNPHRLPLAWADIDKSAKRTRGDGHFLYTGGDDSKIKAFDMVCDGLPAYYHSDEEHSSPANSSSPSNPFGTPEEIASLTAESVEQRLGEALDIVSEDEEDKKQNGVRSTRDAPDAGPDAFDGAGNTLEPPVSQTTDLYSLAPPATSLRELRNERIRSITSSEQPKTPDGEVRSAQCAGLLKPRASPENGEKSRSNGSPVSVTPNLTTEPAASKADLEPRPPAKRTAPFDSGRMRANEHGPTEPDGWVRWDARTHGAGVTAILPLPVPELHSEFVLTGSYDEYVRLLVPSRYKRWQCDAEARLGGGVWRLKLLRSSGLSHGGSFIHTMHHHRGQHRKEANAALHKDGGLTKHRTPYDHHFLVLACCMRGGAALLDVVCDPWRRWRIDVLGLLDERPGLCYAADAVLRELTNSAENEKGTVGRAWEDDVCLVTVVTAGFYEKKLHTWQCLVGRDAELNRWKSKQLKSPSQESLTTKTERSNKRPKSAKQPV